MFSEMDEEDKKLEAFFKKTKKMENKKLAT